MTRCVDPDNESTYVEVEFPSSLEEAKKPEADILRELRRCGYCNETTFAIKLTLEESLTNAVKHGNRCDPCKKVVIRYGINEDKACFIIRDEGPGFDPEAVPDPTAPERISVPSGRGIMLMRAYMDRVEYRDRGREVFFMKRRQVQPPG
ncbi:MAG: ATP-binding protein [Phycisphaerales bacterium]|nr:ATP-binding protein [Phycisphaerales bacterium]